MSKKIESKKDNRTKLAININKSLLVEFRVMLLRLNTSADKFLQEYIESEVTKFSKKVSGGM